MSDKTEDLMGQMLEELKFLVAEAKRTNAILYTDNDITFSGDQHQMRSSDTL